MYARTCRCLPLSKLYDQSRPCFYQRLVDSVVKWRKLAWWDHNSQFQRAEPLTQRLRYWHCYRESRQGHSKLFTRITDAVGLLPKYMGPDTTMRQLLELADGEMILYQGHRTQYPQHHASLGGKNWRSTLEDLAYQLWSLLAPRGGY